MTRANDSHPIENFKSNQKLRVKLLNLISPVLCPRLGANKLLKLASLLPVSLVRAFTLFVIF